MQTTVQAPPARIQIAQTEINKARGKALLMIEDIGSLALHLREGAESAASQNEAALRSDLDDGLEVIESLMRELSRQRNDLRFVRNQLRS